MSKLRLKIGDQVKIIAGHDKGNIGIIKSFLKKKNLLFVSNFNLKFKHEKPETREKSGQIKKIESPIHWSNVMLCDSQVIASRFNMALVSGKKTRVSKKTSKVI